VANNKALSNQHLLVICDLDFPRLQAELGDLESIELDQFSETIKKIQKMTWDQIYKTSSKTQKRGLNWEIIESQVTRSGKKVASIRVTKKFRARVCRDKSIMRFISLHPDHDSTYDEVGDENI
jgi:thiamine biosynthesis protein ThiC